MGTSLRLILLIVGIIILAVVVWDVLRNQSKRIRSGKLNYRAQDLEPELGLVAPLFNPVLEIKDEVTKEPEPIATTDFFAINVLAREAIGFSGVRLLKEFTSIGLEFGKWSIFHKLYNTQILFSVASSKEPGTFKKNFAPNDYFPGIAIFFIISACPNPQLALDEVVKFAKKIAFKLNGELLDKNNKPLTLPALSLYKKELSKYNLAKM